MQWLHLPWQFPVALVQITAVAVWYDWFTITPTVCLGCHFDVGEGLASWSHPRHVSVLRGPRQDRGLCHFLSNTIPGSRSNQSLTPTQVMYSILYSHVWYSSHEWINSFEVNCTLEITWRMKSAILQAWYSGSRWFGSAFASSNNSKASVTAR